MWAKLTSFQNLLGNNDFFTPIHFRIEPPQESSNLEDARAVVSWPRRLILSHASSYLNPFHHCAFYVEGYDKQQNCFFGRKLEKHDSKLWINILKIISIATIILPIIAFVALWLTRSQITCREKSLSSKHCFRLLKTALLRRRAKKAREMGFRKRSYVHALNERASRYIQKGGDIILFNPSNKTKLKAWLSFKSLVTGPQFLSIKLPSDPRIQGIFDYVASAKLVLSEDKQRLTLRDFWINEQHSIIEQSQLRSPYRKNYPCDALVEVAAQVLGAAARYLKSITLDNKTARIHVVGDLANLLTLDGPKRVVRESNITSRVDSANCFSEANSLVIPLEEVVLMARAQIYLPKLSKELIS